MIEVYSPLGIWHVFFYIVLTPISTTSGQWSTGNTRKYQQIDAYIYQCGLFLLVLSQTNMRELKEENIFVFKYILFFFHFRLQRTLEDHRLLVDLFCWILDLFFSAELYPLPVRKCSIHIYNWQIAGTSVKSCSYQFIFWVWYIIVLFNTSKTMTFN